MVGLLMRPRDGRSTLLASGPKSKFSIWAKQFAVGADTQVVLITDWSAVKIAAPDAVVCIATSSTPSPSKSPRAGA